ncbi:hypothetical protein KEM52_003333 [Ascosphaera acerosa]|nr:hypothetical protein KEM52_003333 [Ascosphaera acerosa]
MAGSGSSSGPMTADRAHRGTRGALTRTESTASERTPLSPVRCIQLPASGRAVQIGRSSISCDFQLPPSNRSISRVHVRARFRGGGVGGRDGHDDGDDDAADSIEVVCVGWNGVVLHVQERRYELKKDMVFTSDAAGADVLLDVQGSRVLLQWPGRDEDGDGDVHVPDAGEDEEEEEKQEEEEKANGARPPRHQRQDDRHATPTPAAPPSHRQQRQPARARFTIPPSSPVLSAAATAAPQHADSARAANQGDAAAGGSEASRLSSPVVVYEDQATPPPGQGAGGSAGDAADGHDQENMQTFVHEDTSSDFEPDELSDLDDDDDDDDDGILDSPLRMREQERRRDAARVEEEGEEQVPPIRLMAANRQDRDGVCLPA